jgi:hypothetical protein
MSVIEEQESEEVPMYVFDLLRAFLYSEPLNFKNHPVPEAVRLRIEKAYNEGILKGVRA